MTSLAGRVLAAVRKRAMPAAGGRVLVAVSGGADSVGLLHLLLELAGHGHLRVEGLLHLNHSLRPAAGADEAFCRELASVLGLPIFVEQADVRSLARTWRTSLEDAGRRARYAFFDRIADETRADAVATGHTRDDQAETFLLQLIRGAGPRGLSSISPLTGRLCRPLLEVPRADVRQWLLQRDLAFRDDESNRDPAFTRNRVRELLIPMLQREFSPAIVDVLAREAAIARADDEWLRAAAIEVAPAVVLEVEDGSEVHLDAARLRALHPAIGSRVARLALQRLSVGRFVGFGHVERLLALANEPEGAAVSMPGHQARRVGEGIRLRRAEPVAFANSFHVSLSIPGEVLLDSQGWAVSAAWSETGHTVRDPGGLTAVVGADKVASPLSVRSRRRGDRFRPAGMGGRGKKLQDVFVDRKIPVYLRDKVPLVVDCDDRIVWVVGEAPAEDFRVTTPSRGVLLLNARRLGGLG